MAGGISVIASEIVDGGAITLDNIINGTHKLLLIIYKRQCCTLKKS